MLHILHKGVLSGILNRDQVCLLQVSPIFPFQILAVSEGNLLIKQRYYQKAVLNEEHAIMVSVPCRRGQPIESGKENVIEQCSRQH